MVESGRFDWLQNDKFPSLSRPAPEYHGLVFAETFGELCYTIYGHAVGLRDLGASQAPMNAFLTLLGIETLPLRMERHCANALAVAEYLSMHPSVTWVSYAGLRTDRYHALAQRYLPKGAGAVMTFGLAGGYDSCVRLVEHVELFSHLANIGDARSLIIHPASTTHRQLTDAQLAASGASADAIRLSIGIESVDDIIADLGQALGKAAAGGPVAA